MSGAGVGARVHALTPLHRIFELTPAFFGAGILSGMNASFSFLLGAFLAWGLIGAFLSYERECWRLTPSQAL